MKKIFMPIASLLTIALTTTAFAANPITQESVMKQIAASTFVTADSWSSVCTSGSPTSAGGCYGDASSSAFASLSAGLGGFLRYANINPVSAPSSVFIKAFFAGTNTPAQAAFLNVGVTGAARCALYTQVGHGLGLGGVSTTNPASGNTSTAYVILHGVTFVTINNEVSNSSIYYNDESIGTGVMSLSTVVIPDPIYLLCAGYNTADGTSAAAITVTAT